MPKDKIDAIIESLPTELLDIYSCLLKQFLENVQTDIMESPDRLFKWISTHEILIHLKEPCSLNDLTHKLFELCRFGLIYPKERNNDSNLLWALTEFEGFEEDKKNSNFYVRIKNKSS